MRTATLGRGGPEISRLGIGGWQAGGAGPWGAGPAADHDAAIAAIRHAVESGVSWIDTAASYGLGHSEQVVARALRPWRIGEEVLVFTKCAHPWEKDQPRTDLRPETIRLECEQSLRRLGVERIDMLQFHHPDPSVPVEESWGTMVELIGEGKVRWAGLSNHGVDLLERCEAIRHVDSLQPELSLLRPEARADVIPWCLEHGTGVIVYSPMATGLLSGSFDRADELDPDDWRRGVAAEAARHVERLGAVADRLGVGVGALAVAWTLSIPGVTAAICGARRPEQVDGWIRAAEVVLNDAMLAEIEAGL